jgi:HlyD family secretion protein
MKALRRLLVIVVLVLLTAGGIWLYQNRVTPVTNAASTLTQVATVKQGNLSKTISVVGQLEADQLESLTFSRMSGTAKLATLEIKTGSSVKKGQKLATIDATPYQTALDQAKSDLQAAEETLKDLTTPATQLAIAKADLAVAKTQQALQQAKKDLASIQAVDLTDLQYTVQEAQNNLTLAKLQQTTAEHDNQAKSERDLLYSVAWHERKISDLKTLIATGKANVEQTNLLATEQETLAELQANLARVQASRQLSLKAAAATVAAAEETLANAQEALTTATAGGDKLALAKAKAAVQSAEVALAEAQDSQTTLVAGASAAKLAAAQADVDKKKLALADAEAALAGTTIVAPFDGTILRANTTVGNLVGPTTVVMTVANLKSLQVATSIDEVTIRTIKLGQDATVTFDSFPGQTLRGKVLSVPLQGELQGNVMVYDVPISLTGAENLALLVGMTANVKIQAGQATNALLVPSVAVKQVGGAYQVQMPSDDPQAQPKSVTVEIGLSDGTNTQITKGLNLGDKVIVQYTASTSTARKTSGNIFSQLLGGRNFGVGGR